ncbi:MAG: hypothetical protein Q4Q03_08370 [Bowdeniella nasicola]|nr:hypothetical protein [Bowdeniella nasicola]
MQNNFCRQRIHREIGVYQIIVPYRPTHKVDPIDPRQRVGGFLDEPGDIGEWTEAGEGNPFPR